MNHLPPSWLPARWPRLLLLAGAAALLLAACAATRDPAPAAPPSATLRWPGPPEPPQVAWLKEIRDYRAAGIERSFWQKLVDFVSGEQIEPIAQPYGVFLAGEGQLVVVDVAMAALHIMDQQAGRYARVGGSGDTQFLTPIAVTGDGAGRLYVTDAEAGTVYRYDPAAATLDRFASLGRPTGIAFDRKAERLFVTDTAMHQVVAYSLAGRELFRIGRRGTAPGEFNHPTDLFAAGDGTLYVTDPLNRRVQLFSAEGAYLRSFGAGAAPPGFTNPKGVAVDSDGNLYVCAPLADAVCVFDRDGRFRFAFGSRGSRPGEFWMPSGLHIDSRDTIYVADTYNRRIQLFQRLGADGAPRVPPPGRP